MNVFKQNLRKLAVGLTLLAASVIAALAITPYDSTRNVPMRQLSTQQVNYYRFVVNFNDPSIGTFQQIAKLPQLSFVTNVMVDVVTAFNAGTTNNLTIGTTSANANEIIAATDIPGGGGASISTGVTRVTRGFGRSLTATADTTVYAKFTQTGTAATTGQAIFVIEYIPNNDQ